MPRQRVGTRQTGPVSPVRKPARKENHAADVTLSTAPSWLLESRMSTEPSAIATSAQSLAWDALLFRHPRRDSSTSATIPL
jgi:hypothetical protein